MQLLISYYLACKRRYHHLAMQGKSEVDGKFNIKAVQRVGEQKKRGGVEEHQGGMRSAG